MAASQVELEKFERYNPVNPLPEEIRSLSNDETVCKFCGVSYLIHNEIKKLELELENVKSQLVGYEDMKANFSSLEKDNKDMKDKIGWFELRCSEQEQMIKDLSDSLSAKSGQCNALKDEYSSLSERLEEQAVLYKEQTAKLSKFQKYAKFYPPLLKQLSLVKEQESKLKQEIVEYKHMFDADIKIVTSYLSVMSAKCQEAESKLQESLNETTSLKDKVVTITNTNSGLCEQLAKARDKVAMLERSSASLNHAQQQNVQLSQMASETQREVEECKRDLADSTEEKENLQRTLSGKNQENTELKQRINELTKRHTAQIEDLNKKYKSSLEMQSSLKTKINSHVENMTKDKEHIASQTTRLQAENGELKNELSRLTTGLQTTEERTRHISESHRIQLSELHASYQDQLKSALANSNVYKNEIEKLETMQSKRDSELKSALKQLHDKHEGQIKVMENTYKQSQIDLEKQIDNLSTQYSKDLRTKEQAIKEIEKSFSLQFDTLRGDKTSLQNSVNQLNKQIAEYETTIKQLECKPAPPADESDKLKSLKIRNSQLEKEVLTLQRIVQKECEERLELTERLDQFKAEVCDKKVRENSDVTSRNSVSSVSSLPKVGTGLNHNKKNLKKKMPNSNKANKYSSWLQK